MSELLRPELLGGHEYCQHCAAAKLTSHSSPIVACSVRPTVPRRPPYRGVLIPRLTTGVSRYLFLTRRQTRRLRKGQKRAATKIKSDGGFPPWGIILFSTNPSFCIGGNAAFPAHDELTWPKLSYILSFELRDTLEQPPRPAPTCAFRQPRNTKPHTLI